MRAVIVPTCLLGFITTFLYLTLSYLYPFMFGWVPYLIGLTDSRDDGRVLCSLAITAIFCGNCFIALIFLMRRGTVVEGVIGRFVGNRGIFFDFLSTLIQWGRFLYYEKNIYVIVYISIAFLIVILFFDLFARQPDTNVIARKVAKRCIFGAMILAYQGEMLGRFPVALVPLVPALFAGYILVYYSQDSPQHLLIPNWRNWRVTVSHADVE